MSHKISMRVSTSSILRIVSNCAENGFSGTTNGGVSSPDASERYFNEPLLTIAMDDFLFGPVDRSWLKTGLSLFGRDMEAPLMIRIVCDSQ
jgi:hypothetical protein